MFSLTYTNHSCMFNFTYITSSKCVQLYLHKPFMHVHTTHSCMFNLHKSFKHVQLDRHSHTMYLLQHQRMAQVLHKPDFPFDAHNKFLLGLQTQNPENATMLNMVVLIKPCVNLFFVHDIHLSTQTSFSY